MSDFSFNLEPAEKPRRRGRPPKNPQQAPRQQREIKSAHGKLNGTINGRDDLGSWLWGAADILRGAVSPL